MEGCHFISRKNELLIFGVHHEIHKVFGKSMVKTAIRQAFFLHFALY